MIRILLVILLAMLPVTAFSAEKISSVAIGMHRADEKPMLVPAFINAVNAYLSRYEPRLIERDPAYVKMMVDYDFDYAIELRVKDQEYEITVTLQQPTKRLEAAQKKAAHLVSGVHKNMLKFMFRDARPAGAASR